MLYSLLIWYQKPPLCQLSHSQCPLNFRPRPPPWPVHLLTQVILMCSIYVFLKTASEDKFHQFWVGKFWNFARLTQQGLAKMEISKWRHLMNKSNEIMNFCKKNLQRLRWSDSYLRTTDTLVTVSFVLNQCLEY